MQEPAKRMSEFECKERKFRFKLLQGKHNVNEGTDENPQIRKYVQGDIVETHQRLDLRYNSPGSTKFEPVEYVQPDTPELLDALAADLERRRNALKQEAEKPVEKSVEKTIPNDPIAELRDKSVNELRNVASANGIPLGNAKSKDEILKILSEALQPA